MGQHGQLTTYLDNKNQFLVHHFEPKGIILDWIGQRFIDPLARPLLSSFLLSSIPLMVKLKAEESLGMYLKLKSPIVADFKLELSATGKIRALVNSENAIDWQHLNSQNPLSGLCRTLKFFSNNARPYESIVPLEELAINELANLILAHSYQIDAHLCILPEQDSSLLIAKLPEGKIDASTYIKSWNSNTDYLKQLKLLTCKNISFGCHCSKQKMQQSIQSLLLRHTKEEIFDEHGNVEVKCDFCLTQFHFSTAEF